MRKIIGLTAPVQTGKIQLRPVFESFGFRFVDLNDVIYDRRLPNSDRYRLYDGRFPGCLDQEGVETGIFYKRMTGAFYRSRLEEDYPVVQAAALRVCQEGSENLVLSWEYLARIAPELPLTEIIVFRSDRTVWFKRMRARAAELGWPNIPDSELERIIDILDVDPERMKSLLFFYRRSPITEIDVSDTDWGAAKLRSHLAP